MKNGQEVCCDPNDICPLPNDGIQPANCGPIHTPMPRCCDGLNEYCAREGPDSNSCNPIPACIWDAFAGCSLPGPIVPPTVDPNPPPSPDACNWKPQENCNGNCMWVTGQTCSSQPIGFCITKKTFCNQVFTCVKPSLTSEMVKFPSSCVPTGWVSTSCTCSMLESVHEEFPHVVEHINEVEKESEAKPQLLTHVMLGAVPDKVYRVLRGQETPFTLTGYTGRDPSKTYTVGFHVTSGMKYNTQYISTTKSLALAKAYCKQWRTTEGERVIVELSTATITQLSTCRGIDVSSGEGLEPTHKSAINFAAAMQEVLFAGPLTSPKVYQACTIPIKAVTHAWWNCAEP